MLTTSLLNLFHRQWLGVVDGAQEAGVNLIGIPGRELGNPEAFKAEANVVYDLISPDRFDGLVVWMTPLQLYVGQERMEAFMRRYEPLPMVSVEQVFPGHPSILMDNRSGLRDVVSHLIEVHGHRRIAFVRGPDNHPGAQERYQGYLDALATHGLEADPALVTPAPPTWEPADAAAAVDRLLDEFPGGVDAFAAANDDLALGVLAALRERGVHVPAEVAVVGYDDAMSIVPHALGLESADVGGPRPYAGRQRQRGDDAADDCAGALRRARRAGRRAARPRDRRRVRPGRRDARRRARRPPLLWMRLAASVA